MDGEKMLDGEWQRRYVAVRCLASSVRHFPWNQTWNFAANTAKTTITTKNVSVGNRQLKLILQRLCVCAYASVWWHYRDIHFQLRPKMSILCQCVFLIVFCSLSFLSILYSCIRLYLIYIVVNFLQVVFGHFVIQFLMPSTGTDERNKQLYNQNGSKSKDRQKDNNNKKTRVSYFAKLIKSCT